MGNYVTQCYENRLKGHLGHRKGNNPRTVIMHALSGNATQDLEGDTVRGSLCPEGKGAGTPRERVVSGRPAF
jgi:hypothetical protein